MKRFRAFRIHADRAGIEELALEELSPGEVTIRVHWSGINYKDALAGTGRGRILRRFPLVGGIDLAGVVLESASPQFRPGDAVLVTGCGLSETRDGGYTEVARVPAEAVVPLPPGLGMREAMIVGTAGFAAALAITQLEHNGLAPGQGPVAVTGAGGGVGMLAIQMLATRGYEVVAFSRRADQAPLLKEMGASAVEVLPVKPAESAGAAQGIDTTVLSSRPLESERWAGAIDNVGGPLLSWLIRSTRMNGSVASVGLAGQSEVNVSLMPFLLRGVNLLGVNAAATSRAKRELLWKRIGTDLAPRHLAGIAGEVVTLDELPGAFEAVLAGRHVGRTLVRIADDER
jgi:acrylyl-CoA reductase (NADPH)